MQCEVCGRRILGKPNRVIIERAKMTTCVECAKLGTTHWEPSTEISRQPPKTKAKPAPTALQKPKKVSSEVSEDYVVAEDFASLLRFSREKSGLSYEELGRKIGEKVSVIKKMESGKMAPDQKLAAKLERMFKIKLFVPFGKTKTDFPTSPHDTGVTIGEIVHLKDRKGEASNERRQS